ncbi:MAG: hypothetical protein R2706_08555 [Acidimicrobiales bacterium]
MPATQRTNGTQRSERAPRTGGAGLALVSTGLFPISLGLAGVGSTVRRLGDVVDQIWLGTVGTTLLVVAALTLVLDALLYGVKLVRSAMDVRDEIAMATSANLLAPAFMATCILGAELARGHSSGRWVWGLGALGHVLLLSRFVGRWVVAETAPSELNPTWFLPTAGLMTSAMTWPGVGPDMTGWILFGVGAGLWIMVLPLVFRRVVFEDPLAAPLRPTLFILAAPFGLAGNAMLNLPGIDRSEFATALAGAGCFVVLTLVSRPRFFAAAGVALSWWAMTFPVATVGRVFIELHARDPNNLALGIGAGMLALAAACTGVAVMATVRFGRVVVSGDEAMAEREVMALCGEQHAEAEL